jgi:hypothetical protein
MALRADVASASPVLEHADQTPQQAKAPPAPRWMTWVPRAALAWALAFGSLQAWWAVGNSPSFPPPQGTDLIFFSGWAAVGLCAGAAVVTLSLRTARWGRPLFVAAWGVSAALVAASPLLLLDVVGALFPGMGVEFQLVAFMSRASGLAGGILVGATAVAYRRRWRSACMFCGRTGTRVRSAQPPRWAWWAAYVAIAGCLVRLGVQVAVGVGEMLGGGWSLLGFEAGFLLAGTVLPLALVLPWGRVLPRWVPLLAGRRVPRWLLLGPASAIGGLMTVYFGFTLVKITAETLTGTWDAGSDSLPLAFFWVAVPAYLVWGLGLAAAALGYHQVTRPRCRVCGQ